jgi:hypothetical protein
MKNLRLANLQNQLKDASGGHNPKKSLTVFGKPYIRDQL